jgi:hypothetical protein
LRRHRLGIQKHGLADVVERADVRVVQARNRPRFALEAGAAPARAIHQDAAHQAGAQRVEMSSVLPLYPFALHEPYESLMHQRGRLQRVATGRLGPHARVREATKPVVDEGKEAIKRVGLALPPAPEKTGDVWCRRRGQGDLP